MPRQAKGYPTEFELQILQVLWKEAPLPVSSIRNLLAAEGRDNAHTSIITMLNIMVAKGYVDKKREGKSYQYWAIVSESQISQLMVGDMVNRLFDGSAKRLVLNLLDHENMQEHELLELRKLINRKVREQQK